MTPNICTCVDLAGNDPKPLYNVYCNILLLQHHIISIFYFSIFRLIFCDCVNCPNSSFSVSMFALVTLLR